VALTQADAVGNPRTTSRRITITATPVYCVVPKVVGKAFKKAKTALKRSHCRAGKVSRAYSKRIKKGRVLRVKPKAGKRLPVGARVSLVVSRGKKPARR
jgi:beta-lactam-binding protein with PASTA domain